MSKMSQYTPEQRERLAQQNDLFRSQLILLDGTPRTLAGDITFSDRFDTAEPALGVSCILAIMDNPGIWNATRDAGLVVIGNEPFVWHLHYRAPDDFTQESANPLDPQQTFRHLHVEYAKDVHTKAAQQRADQAGLAGQARTQFIMRTHNDEFRKQIDLMDPEFFMVPGMVTVTHKVEALGREAVATLLQAIREQTEFPGSPDHSFGVLTYGEATLFWSLTCYDRDLAYQSPDPTDLFQTVRVLLIYFPEED